MTLPALQGQDLEPGQSYFAEKEYAEYIHGNLPIILSSPHGGEKRPSEIDDRDCNGCVTINDTNTQELTREVAAEITELTGCYPYVIINRLHRSKLDANRAIGEAADGNSIAEEAWRYYHGQVDSAEQRIIRRHGRGLFLDMHGHGHEIKRLELGYLMSRSELQMADDELDTGNLYEESSIRRLTEDNPLGLNFSELLRGDQSFGHLIDEEGHRAVPSSDEPYPEDNEDYFTGGYNTRQYGSLNGGMLDAIQIECHQDVRFNESPRKQFAKDLALVIVEYMTLHYSELGCTVSAENVPSEVLTIYPNPTMDHLFFSTQHQNFSEYRIYNCLSQNQNPSRPLFGNRIDISELQPGLYYLQLLTEHGHKVERTVVKL